MHAGAADVDVLQVRQDRAGHDGAGAAGAEPMARPLGKL